MNRIKAFSAALLVALALIATASSNAIAELAQDHYRVLKALPGKFKDGVSAVDTTVWTTPLAPQDSRGNPRIAVSGEFGTASATCVVAVGLYYKDASDVYTFLGFGTAKSTLTALSTETVSGRYPAGAHVTFETAGAPYYDVRIYSISAGTVTLRTWGYGADSKGP